MYQFECASAHRSAGDHGQDRVGIINCPERMLIVVADGAGGMGDGDVAADTVIREIDRMYGAIDTADQWAAALGRLDYRIGSGESTAVVVDVRPSGVFGASVGDSRAFMIDNGEFDDLTALQKRKPLLGSQAAVPVPFARPQLNGLLLVGTDGFWNYVNQERLEQRIPVEDFYSLPGACIRMVELKSNQLWDDVAVVACRQRPKYRTRQRYSI